MSEASTSLGANPFTYYGQQSNSEVENAKNHFIESWVKPTLIATVAAAVATPLAVLAGMKWGALALTTIGLGFIATPASGIALGILAAAVVTIITLAAVLAIQSCYRCQNSGEANRQMLSDEVRPNGSSDTPIVGDLENSNEANRQMPSDEVRSNGSSDTPIVGDLENSDEANRQTPPFEAGLNGSSDTSIGGDLNNSGEANSQMFPVEINSDDGDLIRGCVDKREGKWLWFMNPYCHKLVWSDGDDPRPIVVIFRTRYEISLTRKELNKKYKPGKKMDKLIAKQLCNKYPNSDEANTETSPVDHKLSSEEKFPVDAKPADGPEIRGYIGKIKGEWFWFMNPCSQPLPRGDNKNQKPTVRHRRHDYQIPLTFEQLDDKYKKGEREDKLIAERVT